MKVLIAGCGDVGTRVGRLLAAEGDEVWGLRRRADRVPVPLRGLAADLADPAGLPELPQVDLVVYALAADGYSDEAYRRAYVDGVRHLLASLEGGVRVRWLHVSSTSVYAQKDGEWVDEGSPAEPESFAGRRILEGERLVMDSPHDAVVLRLSGIYGPGRTRLLDRVRRGEAPCYEPPVYTNRIHVEDAAGALAHLARLESPEPLYLGVDAESVPDGVVKRWLAERMGAPEPGVGTPSAGSRAQRSNKRCSSRRLLASGYRLRYADFREGYGEMIGGDGKTGVESVP